MQPLGVLAVLLALGGAVGRGRRDELPCPSPCRCSAGSDVDVTCPLRGGDVRITGQRGSHLSVECDEGSFECEDLPQLQLGSGVVVQLGLNFCPLPDSAACAARRLGAKGLSALTVTAAPGGGNLTGEQAVGLELLETLSIYGEIGSDDAVRFPREAVARMPALRKLTLSRARLQLQEGDLDAAPPLLYLELSQTQLTAIPRGLFRAMSNLTILMLWSNKLRTLDDDALRGLSSLSELSLSTNELELFPAKGVAAAAPALSVLSLYGNRLKRLGRLGALKQLRKLELFDNRAKLELEPRALADLPALTSLDLHAAGLDILPSDAMLNSSALVTLDLADNQLSELPAELFASQVQLTRLDLSRNKLNALLPATLRPLRALQELKLDGNNLMELPATLLDGLRRLTVLSVEDNHISFVSQTALSGAAALRDLSLANNLIGDDNDTDYLSSPFNSLHELQRLDLSRNRMLKLLSDLKLVLLDLRIFNASHNRIAAISHEEVSFMSSANLTVDLRHNEIQRVQLLPANQSEPLALAARILLAENPIACDCGLYPLVRRFHGFRPAHSEPAFDATGAVCATPPELRGRGLGSLQLDELVCGVPTDDCVPGCDCRVRADDAALEMDCEAVPPELPPADFFGARRILLRLRTAPPSLAIGAIEPPLTLNLSGLGLTEVPPGPAPATLTVLDLSGNELTAAPLDLLRANVSLRLARNNLTCSCWRQRDLDELLRSGLVQDIALVTCDDGAPLDPELVEQLCDAWRTAGVGATLATVALVLAVVSALVYRRRYRVAVFLYRYEWFRRLLREDALDAGRDYDVFVSHAHEDERFVAEELIPRLEAAGLRVCVHYRDWVIGEWIPKQIAESVERSRRTLVVLSRAFLASKWGLLEFRAANMAAEREWRSRLLFVLLDDAAPEHAADPELRAHLLGNTYLKRDDPRFWAKLLCAIPPRAAHPAPRAAKKSSTPRDPRMAGRLAEKLGAMLSDKLEGGLDTQLAPGGKIYIAATIAHPSRPPSSPSSPPPSPSTDRYPKNRSYNTDYLSRTELIN